MIQSLIIVLTCMLYLRIAAPSISKETEWYEFIALAVGMITAAWVAVYVFEALVLGVL